MRNRMILFIPALFLFSCAMAGADDSKIPSSGSGENVRDSSGFNLDIPKDMRVTRVGNVVKLEAPENYISRKIEEQNQKIDEQNQKIEELTRKYQLLNDRLNVLKKTVHDLE